MLRLYTHYSYLQRIKIFTQHTVLRVGNQRIHYSSNIQQSHNDKLTSNDMTYQFLELENQLSIPNLKLERKAQLLLSNPQYLDVFDIDLQPNELKSFFTLLIKYNINFNKIRIMGIGKIMKLLPINTPNGIQLIKNCGILNPKTQDDINNVFINLYNSKMKLLTISLLIQYRRYSDAAHFLSLCDSSLDNNQLIKYKFKLQKFINYNYNITASQIIESNIIHLYLKELSKSNSFTLKQKFEYYLLTVFKVLSLNPSYFTSGNQIMSLNSTFLSLLYHQPGINYTIFYAYFITLYPNAEKTIEKLGLKPDVEIPKINIRSELIQQSLPYLEDLALLYSKYFHEIHPSKNHLKKLFRNYLTSVISYQYNEIASISNQHHPFSKFNHDNSILSTFIDYTFTNQPFALFKPKLISNLIIKFYTSLKISYIDHKKSFISFTHKQQLQNLIEYLLNPKKTEFDLEKALLLIQLLSNHNIYLHGSTYMKIIEALVKLDFNEYAKSYYIFFANDPMISSQLSHKDVAVYCNRFKWPYPKYSNSMTSPETPEFNEDYLSGNLAPEKIITSLNEYIK